MVVWQEITSLCSAPVVVSCSLYWSSYQQRDGVQQCSAQVVTWKVPLSRTLPSKPCRFHSIHLHAVCDVGNKMMKCQNKFFLSVEKHNCPVWEPLPCDGEHPTEKPWAGEHWGIPGLPPFPLLTLSEGSLKKLLKLGFCLSGITLTPLLYVRTPWIFLISILSMICLSYFCCLGESWICRSEPGQGWTADPTFSESEPKTSGSFSWDRCWTMYVC